MRSTDIALDVASLRSFSVIASNWPMEFARATYIACIQHARGIGTHVREKINRGVWIDVCQSTPRVPPKLCAFKGLLVPQLSPFVFVLRLILGLLGRPLTLYSERYRNRSIPYSYFCCSKDVHTFVEALSNEGQNYAPFSLTCYAPPAPDAVVAWPTKHQKRALRAHLTPSNSCGCHTVCGTATTPVVTNAGWMQ